MGKFDTYQLSTPFPDPKFVNFLGPQQLISSNKYQHPFSVNISIIFVPLTTQPVFLNNRF